MKVGLVYARARNGVIGKQGVLPWYLPEDLAHFKRTTLGAPVIMGRKTWDSTPPRFRPLPGRRNIVVTRQAGWSAPGAERVDSLEAALALCAGVDTAWVIGGAEIFRLSLPLADVVVVTEIDADYEGDTHMPELGPEWTETARERHTGASGVNFSFVTYRRKQKC